MMSDLVKAQNMPQFNWFTRWTSLGADGKPDKLIKEGLKQPNWIKISFEKNSKDSNSKEITSKVAPDQALFGVGYFLAYTLPNFKSKILTQLLNAQKANGPLLFNLMGQCFQVVGLTEWTSVIVTQCINNEDCTKANFDECIGIILRPSPHSWTQATSWFAGFVLLRSRLSCQCMSSYSIKYSFSATSRVVTSVKWCTYLRHKRRVNKSSSRSPRRTRTSLPIWTRWCLLTCSRWLPSLSSVWQPTRQLAFLRRLPRTSSQRKGKQLSFLLH